MFLAGIQLFINVSQLSLSYGLTAEVSRGFSSHIRPRVGGLAKCIHAQKLVRYP